jgi:hypothetical protein
MKSIAKKLKLLLGGHDATNHALRRKGEAPLSLNATQSSKDRRNYGLGVKLWDDRDPRADQSFFLGGVPGFILSSDQKILDWNVAFEIAFDADHTMKRGISISEWYKKIDNFKRLPNRQDKLFGDSLLPITDRERVVYVSPKYGRMVFTKIMSPIIDRMNGRIIGWSLSLNINSVTERVTFFEDLYQQIQKQSDHSRYVLGLQMLAEKSTSFAHLYNKTCGGIQCDSKNILIIGAALAPGLIDRIFRLTNMSRVTVVDDDSEALRTLKSKVAPYKGRVKLVRKKDCRLTDALRDATFDHVVCLRPATPTSETSKLIKSLKEVMPSHVQFTNVQYSEDLSAKGWWDAVQTDLEAKGELDLLKWHWPIVAEHEAPNAHSLVQKSMAL